MFVEESMKGMREVTEGEVEKVFEKYYGGVFGLVAIVENMKLGVKYDLGDRKYAWCDPSPKPYVAETGKKIPAVAVEVEVSILDEFKKDIPGLREELEKIVDELADLLDRFNNKYGAFLKLEADIDFSVPESCKEG